TAAISLFLLLAMAFGSTLLGHRFRFFTSGTIATLIVFGLLVTLQVDKLVANEPTPWMGIEERVNIYATMLWLAVLAIGLWRTQCFSIPGELMQPRLEPHGATRVP